MVKSDRSRVEEEVVVALQLENGERLQASFPPSITLWDLLLHWESKSDRLDQVLFTFIVGYIFKKILKIFILGFE